MPPLHGFSAQATEVTEVRFFGGNDHEVGGLAIVLRLVPDVAAMKATSPRFHVFVVLPAMVRLNAASPVPRTVANCFLQLTEHAERRATDRTWPPVVPSRRLRRPRSDSAILPKPARR
jgi:hypothetical protein